MAFCLTSLNKGHAERGLLQLILHAIKNRRDLGYAWSKSEAAVRQRFEGAGILLAPGPMFFLVLHEQGNALDGRFTQNLVVAGEYPKYFRGSGIIALILRQGSCVLKTAQSLLLAAASLHGF